MFKNANGEPLEALAPATKGKAEPVREYIVLHGDYEPCGQLRRNDDPQRREWMISDELELVAGLADDPHGPSETDTSAAGLPRTRIS